MRPSSATIDRLVHAHRIAVVGLSDDPSRPSYGIASFLLSQGREVLPVNPNVTRVLGHACYASLSQVPGPIELVNVFRRAEFCPQIVQEAIAAGAHAVWLQSGIISPEAERLATDASLDFVQDRCLMVEIMARGDA